MGFVFNIKMTGRFIEQKKARCSNDGSGNQYPLTLSTRERAAHIANLRVISHRQLENILMDGCLLRGGLYVRH